MKDVQKVNKKRKVTKMESHYETFNCKKLDLTLINFNLLRCFTTKFTFEFLKSQHTKNIHGKKLKVHMTTWP